jgi:adenylate cyclase
MMGIEIERKFLVNKEKWNQRKPLGLFVRQGYLLTDPEKTIRVRLTGHHGFLTIKGKTTGATRSEFEYEIPGEDAKKILETFSCAVVSKVRFEIIYHEKLWEIDEFLDENEGLIIAEIELKSEEEKIDFPEWIEKEITGDARYYNASLAENPFKNWQ